MVEAKHAAIKERLLAIQIESKTVDNILKNDKVVAQFEVILDMAGVKECSREKGNLLYAVTTKGKNLHKDLLVHFVQAIMDGKWNRISQVDAAVDYITMKVQKVGKDYRITDEEIPAFEAETGVGVVVTQEQIDKFVEDAFKAKADQIEAKKHDFNFSQLLTAIRDQNKWADGALVLATINKKKLELLGEPPADTGARKKVNKMTTEEKKKVKEETKTVESTEPKIDISQLIGRDVDVGNNAEILAKHRAATGGKVVTRFPPEPNGYLHIGHAKAIRFNFEVAKQYGGYTYLRYDDTNPDKECQEYIDHIAEIVNWLGYKPIATTASSDYFQELYDIAVKLIKKGLAYVCFQNKEEMSHYRENKLNPPTRDNSVEWNLAEFEKMRTGRYEEGKATLRCKIDMQHDNPNMRDFVAYRIKFTPHPHSGDKWCIYPTYDYTHCLCDSLENITHSLCTLEFEIRRESYYWLLKAAEMYQPFVWEYSRLNLTNTVLSKRKIEKLIANGLVTGWNDPRLHTVQGLKRRGYTPSMINDFCEDIGVARKGNENYTSAKKLESFARKELDATATRVFAVLEPLMLNIVNFDEVEQKEITAPLFPSDPSKGSRTYTLTQHVFVEREDFSATTKPGFFGIMPEQVVCLRYGPFVVMESVEKDAAGNVTKVNVRAIKNHDKKVKGVIHWVSVDHSTECIVNEYDVLLLVEDVVSTAKKEGKDWLEYFNKNSLVPHHHARIWSCLNDVKPYDRFQFERLGYFCVDEEARSAKHGGKIVFNSIVALKESAEKKKGGL